MFLFFVARCGEGAFQPPPFQSLAQMKVVQRHWVPFSLFPVEPSGLVGRHGVSKPSSQKSCLECTARIFLLQHTRSMC